MKTYEEILKDENRFFNNWENYRLYKDGDTVIIDYPDEVCNNPTQEGQKKALRLLCKVYNEIKPYKEQIKADARRIKEEREKRIIWDSFRRIEECLNMFLEEYEKQKDCIEEILGEQTSNGQKKDKQSANNILQVFPPYKHSEKLTAIKCFLEDRNFIEKIDSDSFCYWFGCVEMQSPKKIYWTSTKQILRELLTYMYGYEGKTLVRKIGNIVPCAFNIKDRTGKWVNAESVK